MGKRRFLTAVMAGCVTAATIVGPAAADSTKPPPGAGPMVTDAAGGRPPGDGPVLIPPGTGSPELEALRRLVSSPAPAFGASAINTVALPQPCWDRVRIRSNGNGLYVSADHNISTSPLRARTSYNALGAWEYFKVCRNANNWQTAMQADDGKWVWTTAGSDTSGGRLYAFDAQCGCDQNNLFTSYTAPGQWTLTWFYSLSKGLYVSNQLDYAGDDYTSLRARLGSVGPWEWFAW